MAQGGKSVDEQFKNFAKFGDAKADGKTITLAQIEEWFKQANLLDQKVTKAEIQTGFEKFKSKAISSADFTKLLEDLAKQKNTPIAEIKDKLAACNPPAAK